MGGGALCIAIAQSKLGASVAIFACTAIFVHGNKVQGSIQGTLQFAVIDRVRELAVLEVEHLVVVLAVHQVRA